MVHNSMNFEGKFRHADAVPSFVSLPAWLDKFENCEWR